MAMSKHHVDRPGAPHLGDPSVFLARAAAELAACPDHDALIERIAWLPVPEQADWCFLDLGASGPGSPGTLDRAAVAYPQAGQAPLAAALTRPFPTGRGPIGTAAAERARASASGDEVVCTPIERLGCSAEELRALTAAELRVVLSTPIVARGMRLGTLSFGLQRWPVDPALETTLRGLAACAALALDSSRRVREAELAAASREQLLGVAAHEFKSPLTTLTFHAEWLRLRLGGTVDWDDRIAMIDRQVARITRLSDEMLDVARVAAGRLKLSSQCFDVRALVAQCVEQATPAAIRAGCTLNVIDAAAADPLSARADAVRIETIVANLLSNAIRHGAGHPVDVRLDRQADRVLVAVQDRGPGLAADVRAALLAATVQSAPKSSRGGLGVGLWVARHALAQMGGRLAWDAGGGAGACLTVELPAAR